MFGKSTIIAAVAAICLALTGCTNPLQTARYEKALAPMVNQPLEGFELTDTVEPVCGIDYCEPNISYTFTKNGNPDSKADFCKKLIAWVKGFGADSWPAGDDFIAMPLEGHEAAAQFACVGGSTSFLGYNGDVRWWVVAGPTSYQLSTVMNREGNGLSDDRMLPRTWEEARADLFAGTRLNMDILSAIETYRIVNPDADPTSKRTIEAALARVELDPATKLVFDENGKVKYIDIPADDILLERCLNIGEYDPEYFGVISPGEGFLSAWLNPEEEIVDEFGYLTSGSCK